MYGRAVEFPDSGTWLNVDEPLSMEKLKGHVVLLDFWTYCCINCIHVIADLKWLEARFSNKPLVVIGVHSAKFENERQERNIQAAIQRYGIAHPVFVDNEYHLWDRYAIRAWPSFVLIGSDGKILSRTSGEGKRDYLSNEIARALEDGERRGILSREKLEVKPPVPTGGSTLSYPGKISFGNGETLFISDSNNNRILITRLDGKFDATVTDIIGGGSPGMSDGGFEKATFNKPQGIVYSGGHLYIADTENHAIRRASIEERTVTTVSGDGLQGYNWNYSGEASRARLNSPWDLQSDGAYLYIAMAGTHQIWRLDTRSNTIEAFAGNSMENIIDGSLREASFAQPSGLFLNGRRLYVADSEVSAIRFIDLDG
ncbi:MAG TPA: thioredoxin-like domain-containing protein, partial [Mesotoga sp.]|nr:thioredoxin-like domain-containing protein [Mesotoga sp.]